MEIYNQFKSPTHCGGFGKQRDVIPGDFSNMLQWKVKAVLVGGRIGARAPSMSNFIKHCKPRCKALGNFF
jgi:hypothetical protein